MNDLQTKLTQLLAEYFEFPAEGIDIELQREGESMALTASIPVKAMKRRTPRLAVAAQLPVRRHHCRLTR